MVSKTQKPVRKYPKAEVKLTKTAQLRLIKSDPLLQLSALSNTFRYKLLNFTVLISQNVLLEVSRCYVFQPICRSSCAKAISLL